MISLIISIIDLILLLLIIICFIGTMLLSFSIGDYFKYKKEVK